MSKRFRIAKRISKEDIGHLEDIEVDDDFVDNEMVQIIADNEYDPVYDYCESIAVALQLAGYGKVADLEAKLAEKDEQLEYFSKRDDEQEKQLEKQALFHRKSIKELQNQKAIEQLEKVKMYIDDNAYYIDEKEFGIEINEYIDNQINELKEGK